VGTLGSGNHFLEVQRVDEVYDLRVADALGIHEGQLTVMIHSGSRGLGYQVCDDALRVMGGAMVRHRIAMPDRQLACVPLRSAEGEAYLGAMAAAANFAWANRQVMTGLVERAFEAALDLGPAALGFGLVYDVCHNIAKLEQHVVDGRPRRVVVHRKGATRAFGPGHPALPASLRAIGQPVIIPGDMGRYSFLLVGTATAMRDTFGSTCHGAGRVMSRAQAKKAGRGRDVIAELAARGVVVRAQSARGVAEEMSWAYKDVADVVDVIDRAGIGRKVARLKPLVVVKG
jgi:tRNA-splicing ligase RtcB